MSAIKLTDGKGCGGGAKSYDGDNAEPSKIIEYSLVGGKNRACCVPLTVVFDTRFQTPPAGTRQLFLGALYVYIYILVFCRIPCIQFVLFAT